MECLCVAVQNLFVTDIDSLYLIPTFWDRKEGNHNERITMCMSDTVLYIPDRHVKGVIFVVSSGNRHRGLVTVTILFPHHSVLLFTHTHRLLTWRGRRHSYINTSYLFIRTLSSFCFLDLSMDIANS